MERFANLICKDGENVKSAKSVECKSQNDFVGTFTSFC